MILYGNDKKGHATAEKNRGLSAKRQCISNGDTVVLH